MIVICDNGMQCGPQGRPAFSNGRIVIAVGNLGGEHTAAKEEEKQENGGLFHNTLRLKIVLFHHKFDCFNGFAHIVNAEDAGTLQQREGIQNGCSVQSVFGGGSQQFINH